MGVLWGEDIHLSADPTLCLFAISRDPLISVKGLSRGLLSFCPREGLRVLVSTSIFTHFKT